MRRGHLSFRSGNPALTSKTFENFTPTSENVMTLDGTVNKIAISLMILLFCSYYTFSTQNVSFIMVGIIGGLITAIVTIFKKQWAPYTVPIYAALEGLALGGISKFFETLYPGIVNQAVFLTFGTLAALLLAYRS